MSAVIIGLDRAIKRVLAVAKPDTLVFFLTDNGRNLGSNNPLRGGKSDIYEGGIRVPFMAMQVGTVAAGQVRSVPAGLRQLGLRRYREVGGATVPSRVPPVPDRSR
jgi:arylsulfatase A-like enzyme